MGIGRFAFTPLLPMMLADGVVDLPGASWLASANYLGYLVGALLCTLQPWVATSFRPVAAIEPTTWLRAGLLATCGLTVCMALPLPAWWPWLRFLAGVASAFVFVFTSGWCLARLAERQASSLGGIMYTGPGAGIAISGVLASGMVAVHWQATAGWVIFGVLACVLTALVWRTFDVRPALTASAQTAAADAAGPQTANPADSEGGPVVGPLQIGWLAVAYGLDGLGYIITATFLPVIARQVMPGSPWLDLFWPLFGLAVVAGAVISTASPSKVICATCWPLVTSYKPSA